MLVSLKLIMAMTSGICMSLAVLSVVLLSTLYMFPPNVPVKSKSPQRLLYVARSSKLYILFSNLLS